MTLKYDCLALADSAKVDLEHFEREDWMVIDEGIDALRWAGTEIQRLRSKHLAIISEYEHRRDECTGFAGVLYDLAKDAMRGNE